MSEIKLVKEETLVLNDLWKQKMVCVELQTETELFQETQSEGAEEIYEVIGLLTNCLLSMRELGEE